MIVFFFVFLFAFSFLLFFFLFFDLFDEFDVFVHVFFEVSLHLPPNGELDIVLCEVGPDFGSRLGGIHK